MTLLNNLSFPVTHGRISQMLRGLIIHSKNLNQSLSRGLLSLTHKGKIHWDKHFVSKDKTSKTCLTTINPTLCLHPMLLSQDSYRLWPFWKQYYNFSSTFLTNWTKIYNFLEKIGLQLRRLKRYCTVIKVLSWTSMFTC